MRSHQTIRLSRGSHRTPAGGACVMELASMLAGEPFSDHPGCVCPVLGEFLRTYNDEVDDERRQDLYAIASLVVGSNAGRAAETLRANMCLRWWARAEPLRAGVRGWVWGLGPNDAQRRRLLAGRVASVAAAAPELHASALALLTDMASVCRPKGWEAPPPLPAPARRDVGSAACPPVAA